MPGILCFCDWSSKCSEELPKNDQNEYGICSDLHDTIGFGHERKILFHCSHVSTQCLKEEAGYRIQEL